MRTRTILTAISLLVLTSLAGCVSDDGGNATAGDDVMMDEPKDDNITIEMQDVAVGLTGIYPATIAYNPATITVQAGIMVNLTFINNDQNPVPGHDWVLEGFEGNASTEVIGNGESATIQFMPPGPGEYVFYCSVPQHRANGMEGTFIVEGDAMEGGNATEGNETSGNGTLWLYL